jgi:hypothetical protein
MTQTPDQTLDVRPLTEAELEDVNGGSFWHFLGNVGLGLLIGLSVGVPVGATVNYYNQ